MLVRAKSVLLTPFETCMFPGQNVGARVRQTTCTECAADRKPTRTALVQIVLLRETEEEAAHNQIWASLLQIKKEQQRI